MSDGMWDMHLQLPAQLLPCCRTAFLRVALNCCIMQRLCQRSRNGCKDLAHIFTANNTAAGSTGEGRRDHHIIIIIIVISLLGIS